MNRKPRPGDLVHGVYTTEPYLIDSVREIEKQHLMEVYQIDYIHLKTKRTFSDRMIESVWKNSWHLVAEAE